MTTRKLIKLSKLLIASLPNFQEPSVVAAYRNFLANLVSAQGYYVKPVVRMLISNFIGFTDRQVMLEQQQQQQTLTNIDLVSVNIFRENETSQGLVQMNTTNVRIQSEHPKTKIVRILDVHLIHANLTTQLFGHNLCLDFKWVGILY
jgi:hypothetical protein